MQSYEVDPLECPKCGSTMRLIAVIDEAAVIRRILKPLRLWNPHPKEPDHPARDPPWPAHTTIPLTYHPVPDIACAAGRTPVRARRAEHRYSDLEHPVRHTSRAATL